MDFIKQLENNSILVIPYNLRNKVLEYIESLQEIKYLKIMTFQDLKYGLYYDYRNEAIYHVMKAFNLTYNIAKSYMEMLYYIEDFKKDDPKYNYLESIKNYLLDHNLLENDHLFIPLLKSKKKMYVYGFSNINKFNKHLLDKASKYIDYEIIESNNHHYEHKVYENNTLEDEVSFVAEEISNLINNGVDMNKIYIANYSDEYYFTMNYIFSKYHLPFFVKSNDTLANSAIGNYFLNHLDLKKDKIIDDLKKKFNDKIYENEIVINKIKSLIDTYYWCDNLNDIKDLIEAELKIIKIPKKHYHQEIKTTDILDNIFLDDEYVFLINFNLGSIPKLRRDEDYLNDAIKPDVLEKSDEYNTSIKMSLMKAIKNIKNLTITYKLTDNFSQYSPSFLIEDESLIKEKVNKTYSHISREYNELLLAKYTDNLIKFNELNNDLPILYYNYNIDYKTYDNSFKGIDNEELLKNIDDKLNFSYSNIDTFYKCPFEFYLNSVLKIVPYKETTQEQFIGSLFHYCLEECVNSDMDPNVAYDEYLNNHQDERTQTNADKFYIERLKEEVAFIINAIKKQYQHSSHNKEEHEKKIEISEKKKISYKIKGYVDKVLYLNNNAFVIDYKTNNKTVDKSLFEYGLDLQLPMYLYLLKRIENIDVAGMYLQHILDLDMEYNPKKDLDTERENRLKLLGYTIDDIQIVENFDDTYEASKVIKSLKVTKDGSWYASAKIMSKDDRDSIYELVERLIYKAIDEVCSGNFNIHPIKIDKKCDACEFCQYKDICFVKPKDFNNQVIMNKTGDDDNE